MPPIAAASLIDPSSLGELASATRDAAQAASGTAAKVASDFESVFASLMIKEMRKTLQPESLFAGDSGDVYGGLFDLFLGQQMAQGDGFGLARMVRESLDRQQGPSAQLSPNLLMKTQT